MAQQQNKNQATIAGADYIKECYFEGFGNDTQNSRVFKAYDRYYDSRSGNYENGNIITYSIGNEFIQGTFEKLQRGQRITLYGQVDHTNKRRYLENGFSPIKITKIKRDFDDLDALKGNNQTQGNYQGQQQGQQQSGYAPTNPVYPKIPDTSAQTQSNPFNTPSDEPF